MSENGLPLTPAAPPAPARWSRRRTISIFVFIVGTVVLAFVAGAAVMFFQLPPYGFLSKGFAGGRAWAERNAVQSDPESESELPRAAVDKPLQTADGFTLCAFVVLNSTRNTQADLLDMRGQLRHRWHLQFSKVWPHPPHVQGPVKDGFVCFFYCYLYPNGELLAVLHGVQQQAVGYGLVKLDKDSNVLWSYAANIHHDIDVAPDGTIYAIQHTLDYIMPERLGFIPAPALVDSIVTLSPDGQPKGQPISLLEALRDSPYAALLSTLEPGPKRAGPLTGPRFDEKTLREDVLHTNSVQVLTPELAGKFPGWKAGQLLVSMRHIDALAVIDPVERKAVWAARGAWAAQHDAQFLSDGNLLLFDNRGLPKGSRVLEYDPRTQAFPWTYSGENWGPFYSSERGQCQRLRNDNTLIVSSELPGEILEVTRGKEVVWAYTPHRFITHARRYMPEQVPFIKGGPRP
jgi:hypothetical protein